MINWHDIMKIHLETFELLINEKSIIRKLDEYISTLESMEPFAFNVDNGSHTPIQYSWQEEIDKIWIRISGIVLNSCIEGLLHFWVPTDIKNCTDKKKKKIKEKNHIHMAKLIQLWYSYHNPRKKHLRQEQQFEIS